MAKTPSNGSSRISHTYAVLAGISGALAVGFGAFGAHALEDSLSPDRTDIYETASFYHFVHTLLLLGLFLCKLYFRENKLLTIAAKLTTLGIAIFSGSLYLLAVRGLLGLESWTWLGAITPVGGLLLMASWVLLAVALVKEPRTS